MKYELGVIGGGNMAEAIVRAAVEKGVVKAERILVADPMPQRRELFEAMGVAATAANEPIVEGCRAVMLAVKPQMLETIGGELANIDSEHQLVISIMAGVGSAKIGSLVGEGARVVRVMPNTPLMAGAGMSAVALGEGAREGDELLAMQVLGAAGEVVKVDEGMMDAVTAVSGSGPAYVFYLAEAMAEAGVELGLDEGTAALLTQQTILGAAMLMRQSADTPAELRAKVTSPGGTTQAAIETMEKRKVKAAVVEALGKAAARSKELGG